jgi:hypothetical protein
VFFEELISALTLAGQEIVKLSGQKDEALLTLMRERLKEARLTPRELQNWLDTGLLKADLVDRTTTGGLRREFTADQAERARLLKALHTKGAKMSQLARANLSLDGQAYVIFDGNELRACRDAASAIACSAVDLGAVCRCPADTESTDDKGQSRANAVRAKR